MEFRLSTLIASLCLMLPLLTSAQEQQDMKMLFGGGGRHNGGWGALTAAYTNLLDQDATLVGVRGGWIIDHRFTLGIAGAGLATKVLNPAYDELVDLPDQVDESRFYLGYGGLLLEPVIAYGSPVHITLPLIIGAGACGQYYELEYPANGYIDTSEDAQAFFVLEPGIEVEMNVIRLLRVGVGASYRYTSDIDLAGTSPTFLHGWNAGISLKVGSF